MEMHNNVIYFKKTIDRACRGGLYVVSVMKSEGADNYRAHPTTNLVVN